VVPWDPGTLRPLFQQLIDGAEQTRVEARRLKVEQAQLPEKLQKEIIADSHFPNAGKNALVLAGPNATARALNDLGVSGKYSDAAIALTALAAIVISCKRSDAKLDELIAEWKKKNGTNPDGAIPIKAEVKK